jgi:hypothetical protein
MAKGGHQNLRSVQECARPGAEAVAAVIAAHDPARRRLPAVDLGCPGRTTADSSVGAAFLNGTPTGVAGYGALSLNRGTGTVKPHV